MKRALFACLLVVVAVPAMAFRTTVRRGHRVAILRTADERVGRTVSGYLQRELRQRGLDAFDAGMTYDDLRRDSQTDADYYVEVFANDSSATAAAVVVGNRNVGVDLAVVISEVAATVRVYDGRTLDLLSTFDLRRNTSGVMPTAVGVGRDHFSLWLPLSFIRSARYRAAARAVAQDAAAQIASVGD